MPKQNIGIRVPDELLEVIDARCKTTGLSRTDVVLQLIQQGLDKQGASTASEADNAGKALYREELPKKLQPWVIR